MFRISGSGAENVQNYAPKIDGWRLWTHDQNTNSGLSENKVNVMLINCVQAEAALLLME